MQERLCGSQWSAAVMVQRPDPGGLEKVSPKGNWEFFKVKAPVHQGWPL